MNKYVEKALKNNINIDSEKIVFISDMHLGTGDNADETINVQHLIFHALTKYNEEGYKVVLLGDTFELAENHDIEKIKNAHDDIMWILSEINNKGNLIVVRGNHDYMLNSKMLSKRISQYDGKEIDFLTNVPIVDSVLVGDKIIALHGNQFFKRYSCWINKIIVKLGSFWKKWQLFFKDYHIAEYTGWQEADECQKSFSVYGLTIDKFIIIGHTHKCNFNLPKFSDCGTFGCMPRCITAAEYIDNKVNVVKWSEVIKYNGDVIVEKNILGKNSL